MNKRESIRSLISRTFVRVSLLSAALALAAFLAFLVNQIATARTAVQSKIIGVEAAIRPVLLTGSSAQVYELCRSIFVDEEIQELRVEVGSERVCAFERSGAVSVRVSEHRSIYFNPGDSPEFRTVMARVTLATRADGILAATGLMILVMGLLFACGFYLLFSIRRLIDSQIAAPLEKFSEVLSGDARRLKEFALSGYVEEIERVSDSYSDLQDRLENAQAELIKETQRAVHVDLARRVAHDIRSPVSALLASISNTEEIPEQKRALLRKVADRISGIADSLLVETKSRSGHDVTPSDEVRTHSSRIDNWAEFLEEVVSSKSIERFAQSGIPIHSHIRDSARGVAVTADSLEMFRALSNVLNNAFESSTKTVTIEGWVANGKAFAKVIDSGTGISPEILKVLTYEEITSKEQGSGLGIKSAADLLRQCGGRLSVTSKPGKGTQVLFELPTI